MSEYSGSLFVLFGGRGRERHISELGAAELLRAAEDTGVKATPVGILPSGEFRIFLGECEKIETGEWVLGGDLLLPIFPTVGGFILGGERIVPSAVFPLLHGDFGEDGKIQGLLESLDIPYIGPDTLSGAISSDKVYSKIIAERVGVPTLPFTVYSRGAATGAPPIYSDVSRAREAAEELFGYPMFIKPSSGGSSIGASRVFMREDFSSAIERAISAYPECERVIIEPYLAKKREIECAYFAIGKELYAYPGEISTESGFYDYGTKYSGGSVRISERADLTVSERELLSDYSKRLVSALSLRHTARIDFFLSDGKIYFNEINAIPGMTRDSLYLKMLSLAGLGKEKFIRLLASFGRGV